MDKKKTIVVTIFILFFSLTSLFSRPWIFGYKIGIEGYNATGYEKNEYWPIEITANLLPKTLYSPTLHAGLIVSQRAASEKAFMNFGLSAPLFVWHNHPLKNNFRRDSAIIPKVDIAIDVAFNAPYVKSLSLMAEPFNFYFGDKQVSVLGFKWLLDPQFETLGWAVKLFSINHFIY